MKPLVYHNGRFWRLDDNDRIPRPSQELMDKVEEIAKNMSKSDILEMWYSGN